VKQKRSAPQLAKQSIRQPFKQRRTARVLAFCRPTQCVTMAITMATWLCGCLCGRLCVCHVDVLCPNDWVDHQGLSPDCSPAILAFPCQIMNPLARGDPTHWKRQMLGIRYEHVILTVAWRPLANTILQASGGMSATAEFLLLFYDLDLDMITLMRESFLNCTFRSCNCTLHTENYLSRSRISKPIVSLHGCKPTPEERYITPVCGRSKMREVCHVIYLFCA